MSVLAAKRAQARSWGLRWATRAERVGCRERVHGDFEDPSIAALRSATSAIREEPLRARGVSSGEQIGSGNPPMAERDAPPRDEREAERGKKQPPVRPDAQRSPHEGEPRPDAETRRRHGLAGTDTGAPPDHEEQARPRDTGRKGA
jgi:hypothetical protein